MSGNGPPLIMALCRLIRRSVIEGVRMTTDDRKNLVKEYIERVWNHGDLAALENLTTESFTYRLGEQRPRDRAGMRQFLTMTRSAFPDWRVEIADAVVEQEIAAVRWFGTVTHQGPFHGIHPTGRQIRVSGISMYRIAGARIAEEWEQTDSLSMLRQLGALPAA
jgi:steroid delta-isomerase-like uncharacterized protein